MAEIQMKYLCDLLQESESAEMAKEALLISICIGSRPLVELILTLFQDYPHEERAGKCDVCLLVTNSNMSEIRRSCYSILIKKAL
ncbi:hypothetical protein OESDEN_11244 [Oesophagostomum dentatum]|uniref:Uncharacterized protein n=1 Tax=Oesophagostomum dentatum TaxID=61180 RepID=A0A0B1SYF8_OESDE|nr:hypothetical protein OESDEN_11244 [Oesophagostomum dentatum]